MYSVASSDAEVQAGNESKHAPCARGYDRHWDFLLACAGARRDAELAKAGRFSAEEIDWDDLVEAAASHGLLPRLAEHLDGLDEGDIQIAKQTVARASAQSARQTLWLTSLLFTIVDLLQREGIAALPYKGPTLAQLLYGNVTLRQYSDLDILVRPADVPRARHILQEAGFTPTLQLNSSEERAYIASGYEYTFHAAHHPHVLELQWRVLPRFYAMDFEVENFFRRAQAVFIGDRSVATLGSEDLLLVLSAHAAKHAWSKLSWIREIAELAKSSLLDWDRILGESRRLGILRIVAISFCLASKLFGTPVTQPVQRILNQDDGAERIAGKIRSMLRDEQELPVESLGYFRLMADLRERQADRLRFWWRLGTTPSISEWSLVRLPGPMFPLYRGLRLVRLASRLARGR